MAADVGTAVSKGDFEGAGRIIAEARGKTLARMIELFQSTCAVVAGIDKRLVAIVRHNEWKKGLLFDSALATLKITPEITEDVRSIETEQTMKVARSNDRPISWASRSFHPPS